MVSNEVIEYVKKHIGTYGADALKNHLIKAGHSEHEVKEVIKSVKSGGYQSPQVQSKNSPESAKAPAKHEEISHEKPENNVENKTIHHNKSRKSENPNESSDRVVKKRNVFLVYLFMFLTFGIYALYWTVSTKRDLNSKGANIPPAIFAFIPLSNIFFFGYYYKGFKEVTERKKLSYIIYLFYLAPFIVSVVATITMYAKLFSTLTNPTGLLTGTSFSPFGEPGTLIIYGIAILLYISVLGLTQFQINKLVD